MMDALTISSTVTKIGNGWFIPIRARDRELLNVQKGDDIEVRVIVRRRQERVE